MPDLIDRYIPQPMAAHLAGLKNDVLRDWRRRELMDGYGAQQENKRWLYSVHDIVELAIVRQLMFTIPMVQVCQWIGSVSATSIIFNVIKSDTARAFGHDVPTDNFMAFWVGKHILDSNAPIDHLNYQGAATIEEAWQRVRKADGANAHIVDTRATAHNLTPDLQRVIRSGLAVAGRDGASVEISDDAE